MAGRCCGVRRSLPGASECPSVCSWCLRRVPSSPFGSSFGFNWFFLILRLTSYCSLNAIFRLVIKDMIVVQSWKSRVLGDGMIVCHDDDDDDKEVCW